MTVWDLNREQINELKQTYACQLRDCGEDKEVMGISYAELVDASLIPDEVIFNHYNGMTFVEDDFFNGKEECSSFDIDDFRETLREFETTDEDIVELAVRYIQCAIEDEKLIIRR